MFENIEIKQKALYEVRKIVENFFTLKKNIVKINLPLSLSSSSLKALEYDDMIGIKKAFEAFKKSIIDKIIRIGEFNILIKENEDLKDLMDKYKDLIFKTNNKLRMFEGFRFCNCNYISIEHKIDKFEMFFANIKKNVNDKYNRYKYKSGKQSKVSKMKLNILYYDENINNEENSDLCAFISFNFNGAFYGCHNFELFKIIIEKIKDSKKDFILICSGFWSKKIFDYCSNINIISRYYIYCKDKQKYIPLIKEYPKLSGVYNTLKELNFTLYNLADVKKEIIKSSNLIYFEDYNSLYIKLHYEFIVKYALYKQLKTAGITEEEFLDFIEKKYPYYLELALQILPEKNEIIDFFYKKMKEKISIEEIREIFYSDDDIKDYIRNYTKESFYYKELNKFLREGDLDAFRILSSHMSKFIFNLYDYRKKNINIHENSNLYRKMYINKSCLNEYKDSIGRVICYPAFTSTSIVRNAFTPKKYNADDELVQIIINQNNTQSAVLISEFSAFPKEREYLFLPFSFFKIDDVQIKSGDKSDPHLIFLTAIKTDKPIEEMFYDFFKNETDKLDPEGLDMLKLCKNNTKIVFNEIYKKKSD